MVHMIVNGMSIRPADDGRVSVDYYDDDTDEMVIVELTVSRLPSKSRWGADTVAV